MKPIVLICNHCGAGMEVDDEITYLTCEHCTSHLKVERSKSVIYTKHTKELKELKKETLLNDIKWRITQLDDEWERKQLELRKQYYGLPNSDNLEVVVVCLGIGVFLFIMGLLAFISPSNVLLPPILMILAFAIFSFGLYVYYTFKRGYKQYKQGVTKYKNAYKALKNELAQAMYA